MTRQGAIDALKNHRCRFADDHGWDKTTLDALDMAIKVLSALPEQPEIILCKDCIWWKDEDCTNPVGMFLPEEDSFCSCGTERRSDAVD